MTQPDHYDPPGTFAPLSITAGKTQSDWESEQRVQLSGHFAVMEMAFDFILNLVEQIPIIGPIVVQIVEALQGIDLSPGGILNAIHGAIDDLGDFAAAIAEAIADFAHGLMSGLVPVNVLNLIGQIPQALFGGIIPIAGLSSQQPNLQLASSFDDEESIADNPDWTWDGAEGRNSPGSARTTANGVLKALVGNAIPVEQGQKLVATAYAKWSGLVSSGSPIMLQLRTNVGDVTIEAVSSPGASGGWVQLQGTYTVPSGVTEIRQRLVVTQAATAGSVWFDDAPIRKESGWLDGILGGLASALGLDQIADIVGSSVEWIWSTIVQTFVNPLGLLSLDSIDLDFSDELAQLGNVAADAWEGLQGLLGDLANIPGTIIGGFNALSTEFNQIVEILAGGIVTPINGLVQAVKDWWSSWFGGGSEAAIPLSQKGATYGVAPLNGSQKIDWAYLPDEIVPTEASNHHFVLTLPGNVSVPNETASVLSGWEVNGSVEPDFTDGTNTRWSYPQPGWWQVDACIAWEDSASGHRQSSLIRRLSDASTFAERVDTVPAIGGAAWWPRNNATGTIDVSTSGELSSDDLFYISTWQNSGAAANVLANLSYVRSVFIGDRQPDSNFVYPVQYDNRGEGASSSSASTLSWSHTAAGANRAVVVFAAWQGPSGAASATYGGTAMTLAASVTRGQIRAAAFVILDPPATTQTVSVTRPSGSLDIIYGNSLSYTGVGGFTGSSANGSGNASMSVSSAADRRVSNMFFVGPQNSQNANLTSYNRTQRFSFTNKVRAGDATGLSTRSFSANTSAPDWVGLAVDLHTVAP